MSVDPDAEETCVYGEPGCTDPHLVDAQKSDLPDAAVAEIAARMFDGDLSRQPQHVQDKVWRDARFALEAALKHLDDK